MQARLNQGMDTLARRLKWARNERELTQSQLAAAARVKQSDISKLEGGSIQRSTALLALARALRVNPDWLDTGVGEWDTLGGGGGGGESNISFTATRGVPLISWVQAGAFNKISDPFQPGDADEWLQCPAKHSSKSYALTVRGTSMYAPGSEQSFREGDRIFVDPEREAHHRSLVIARLDDEAEATFKQLLIEGNKRYLQALNPNWPNRIIEVNGNCTICGVVIGKWESFA